jgi:hypothetical protein
MQIFTRTGSGWISESIEEHRKGTLLVIGAVAIIVAVGLGGKWVATGYDSTWADPFWNWIHVWFTPIFRVIAIAATAALGVVLVLRLRAVGRLHPSMFFALLSAALGTLASLLVLVPTSDSSGSDGPSGVGDVLWRTGVILLLAGIVAGISAAIALFSVTTFIVIFFIIAFFVNSVMMSDLAVHSPFIEPGALGWLVCTAVLTMVAWEAWPTQTVQRGMD